MMLHFRFAILLLKKKSSEGFVPYMGVVAILVMSTLQRYAQLAIDFQLDSERDVSSYRSVSDEPVTIYNNNIFI